MKRILSSLWLALLAVVGVLAVAVSASMSTAVHLLLNAPHALVMGGTGNPDPSVEYVDGMVDNYVMPAFPASGRYAVHTPAEFWPTGTLTFDQSTAVGVTDLETEMAKSEHAGHPLVIVGYSASTRISSIEKAKLMEAGDSRDISFVLVSDINKGNGGIGARFAGLTLPILEWTFDGATRTDTPYHTDSVTFVHDGWADFPIYPGNLLAVANAVAGIQYLHLTYPELDQPVLTPVDSAADDTDYYVIETDIVPLLIPLEQAGVPRPILLAIDEPLRVLIEAGYRRDIDPGAPTPAYLIPVVNPVSLATNFVRSIPVGIDDALEESGFGRPLDTQPSGPFGVGGEDTDLEGQPPGYIRLGNPEVTPTPAEPVTEGVTEPVTSLSAPPVVEPVVESDGEDGGEAAAKKSEQPKPVRPKVRGPGSFDSPKPLRTLARPFKRTLEALTGQRPKPVEQEPDNGADPAPPSSGDDENKNDSQDAA